MIKIQNKLYIKNICHVNLAQTVNIFFLKLIIFTLGNLIPHPQINNYLVPFLSSQFLYLFYITVMGSCQGINAQNTVVHPLSFDGVQILCKTWKNTFSNLFDYTAQSNGLDVKVLSINQPTRVFKKLGKYQLIPYQNVEKTPFFGADAIIDFIQNNEKRKPGEQTHFNIISKISKTKQQPWLVIKSLPSKRYAVKEGDMLRIGKQKVRVKEIIERYEQAKQQDETCTASGLIYEELTREGKPMQVKQEDMGNYQCKFCLETGQKGNPLMAPCNCAGSSKYVHLKCVQIWLTKTINPRTVGKSTVITWKPLVCQLCHKTLPFKVYLDGKRYFTVNIPKPKKPYLVLNPITKEKEGSKAKIYFLVSFAENKQMIIGRKSDSDILISDDSTVSRHHSKIVFQESKPGNGRFYLEDNQSKFGTLVLLRKFFTMKSQLNGVSLQLGGDLLQIREGRKSSQMNSLPQNNLEDLINKTESDSSDDHEEQEEQQQGAPPEIAQPSPQI